MSALEVFVYGAYCVNASDVANTVCAKTNVTEVEAAVSSFLISVFN